MSEQEQGDIRERVWAARTIVDAQGSQEQRDAMEVAAFMGIFEPGHPATAELVQAAREKSGR